MGWGALANALVIDEGASSWSQVAEEVCNSQSSSDQLMEADALASLSEGEALPEPRPGYSRKVWWARALEKLSREQGFETPTRSGTDAVRVISCCSGGCTEATAFKD